MASELKNLLEMIDELQTMKGWQIRRARLFQIEEMTSRLPKRLQAYVSEYMRMKDLATVYRMQALDMKCEHAGDMLQQSEAFSMMADAMVAVMVADSRAESPLVMEIV